MTNAAVEIDFGVTGMTCTSCSARVERKLNKVAGVEATVNYATETASVRYDPASTTPAQLIDVIRGAGYDAFEVAEASPLPQNPAIPHVITTLRSSRPA